MTLSVCLRFGRDIVLFTHIHLLFYCVVFLNNQHRHPGVISLLIMTILSLSLNSLGCYQTDFIDAYCEVPNSCAVRNNSVGWKIHPN